LGPYEASAFCKDAFHRLHCPLEEKKERKKENKNKTCCPPHSNQVFSVNSFPVLPVQNYTKSMHYINFKTTKKILKHNELSPEKAKCNYMYETDNQYRDLSPSVDQLCYYYLLNAEVIQTDFN
jgi:hypothetical protein